MHIVWISYKAEAEINSSPKKTLEYTIPGPNRVRRQWDNTVKVSHSTAVAILSLHMHAGVEYSGNSS